MFISRSFLLSLFLVADICAAYRDAYANSSLFRRVDYDTAPTTTEIFSTGTAGDDGICSKAQITTIDSFLEEVWLLHHAALTAYSEHQTDLGYRMLFTTYLGVGFDDEEVDDFSAGFMDSILDRLNAVSQFLYREGLIDPVTTEKPYIFCGDAFATYAPWDQPAKDSSGNTIPDGTDDNGDTVYIKVNQVFPEESRKAGWIAFWLSIFSAYTFDIGTSTSTMCSRSDRFAATSKASTQYPAKLVTGGTYDRHTFLCDATFDPIGNGKQTHSIAELATIISYDGYPVEGNGKGLDRYGTYSSTLYHEIIHLTDSAGTTGDPFGRFYSFPFFRWPPC
ncbi:hypothetical protein N7507_004940 [Penicillium longicatenatum]|nr:hypothetical protein N7507_004940 [Penicillium longicatenatum]